MMKDFKIMDFIDEITHSKDKKIGYKYIDD